MEWDTKMTDMFSRMELIFARTFLTEDKVANCQNLVQNQYVGLYTGCDGKTPRRDFMPLLYVLIG